MLQHVTDHDAGSYDVHRKLLNKGRLMSVRVGDDSPPVTSLPGDPQCGSEGHDRGQAAPKRPSVSGTSGEGASGAAQRH